MTALLYNANVRIRHLPKDIDDVINKLAALKGWYKWEIVRMALIEYANKHRDDKE